MKALVVTFAALTPLLLFSAEPVLEPPESPEAIVAAHERPLQKKPLLMVRVDSFDDLQAVMERRWPPQAVVDYCSTHPKMESLVQQHVGLLACNWEGYFPKDKCPEGYRIRWIAIVIGRQVRGYAVSCQKGDDAWYFEVGMDETLPWYNVDAVRHLIAKAGDGYILQREKRQKGAPASEH